MWKFTKIVTKIGVESFLSGFTKEDRLTPVVTVTIYWGDCSWDGPVTLKQMMKPMDEKIAALEQDDMLKSIDKETAEIMSEFVSVDLPKEDEEGKYNMCKAIEELREEGKAEGRAEGRVEGRVEGVLDTLVSLVKDGMLSIEEAAKRAEMSVPEFTEKMNGF